MYNVSVVCTVVDSQNMVYTFQHSGYVYGALNSGSPNDDWTVDPQNNSIADYWANIGAGSSATALANAEINTGFLTTNSTPTASASTTLNSSASPSPPAGLSTAAKGGIITGAIIAGLVLIGFVALVVRKRRNTIARPTPAPEMPQDSNYEVEAVPNQAAELRDD